MKLHAQFLLSSSHRFTQAFSSFLLVMGMFRMWGEQTYGVYAYYISIATLVMAVCEFGTPAIFRRELKANDQSAVFPIFILRVGFSLFSAGLFASLYWVFDDLFFLYYAIICLLVTFRVFEYTLEVDYRNQVIAVTKSSIYLIGLCSKLIWIALGAEVSDIALVTVGEHLLFTLIFWRSSHLKIVRAQLVATKMWRYFKSASMIAFSFLVTLLGGRIYVFMIYEILNESAVGQYSICIRIIEMFLLPTQVGISVLLPLFVASAQSQKLTHGKPIYSHILTCTFYGYLLLAFIFIFVQEPLVTLIFSNQFDQFELLFWLTLITPLIAVNNFANVYYIANHMDAMVLMRNVLFVCFSTALGVYFINEFAMIGVIYAMICTIVLVEVSTYLISQASRSEIRLRIKSILALQGLKKSISVVFKTRVQHAQPRQKEEP